MKKTKINLDEAVLHPLPPPYGPSGDTGVRFEPRIARLGSLLESGNLGINLIGLAPGKRAFPFHNHRMNDEIFLVVEGEGEIRIGTARHSIRAGDVISCPAGGPETAHQVINTGTVELRYLAIGTNASPDLIEYPDSGKYKVTGHFGGGKGGEGQTFDVIGRSGESLDYWQGE